MRSTLARKLSRRARRVVVLAAVAALLALAAPPPAAADGGEEVGARQAVLQAIAYLVSSPGSMDPVEDKIADALASDDPHGVDLALVRRAADAVEAGRMAQARVLLQEAIGARSDLRGTAVQPILHLPGEPAPEAPAAGAATGTSVVVTEMAGRGALDGTDLTLLAIAGAAVLLGGWLGLRFRPAHSVHQLRHVADPHPGGAR